MKFTRKEFEKTLATIPERSLMEQNWLVDFLGAERMVRINQLPLGVEDLREVAPAAPDLLLMPKVERAEDVAEVGRLLDELSGGATARPIWLMPILESALGIERALEIATASPRVVALTIGLEDYAADLGVPRSQDGHESQWARGRLVNAARAAGVQAIAWVYGDVDDLAGLARWGSASRALGFVGMGCVHPRQIAAVHRGSWSASPDKLFPVSPAPAPLDSIGPRTQQDSRPSLSRTITGGSSAASPAVSSDGGMLFSGRLRKETKSDCFCGIV